MVVFPILPWHVVLEPHVVTLVRRKTANYQLKKSISYSAKMFSHLSIDLICPCLAHWQNQTRRWCDCWLQKARCMKASLQAHSPLLCRSTWINFWCVLDVHFWLDVLCICIYAVLTRKKKCCLICMHTTNKVHILVAFKIEQEVFYYILLKYFNFIRLIHTEDTSKR